VAQPDPFACRELEVDEHTALRALYKGEATEHQQRLALGVIVNVFCRTHDLAYQPGSFDGTAFVNGRAYVGAKILKYLNLPVGKLQQEINQ
jgi:hypothetical protein